VASRYKRQEAIVAHTEVLSRNSPLVAKKDRGKTVPTCSASDARVQIAFYRTQSMKISLHLRTLYNPSCPFPLSTTDYILQWLHAKTNESSKSKWTRLESPWTLKWTTRIVLYKGHERKGRRRRCDIIIRWCDLVLSYGLWRWCGNNVHETLARCVLTKFVTSKNETEHERAERCETWRQYQQWVDTKSLQEEQLKINYIRLMLQI
jgi:hypothetical protein